jgi:hypothetical protein
MAWHNRGWTADHIARARSFFEHALAADPANVDALVGSARADLLAGANLFLADAASAFLAAETNLAKALSLVPDRLAI